MTEIFTPVPRSSARTAFRYPNTPCLLAAYVASPGVGRRDGRGGDHEDVARATGTHPRCYGLDGVDDSQEVDVDLRVRCAFRFGIVRTDPHHAGAIDENVHRSPRGLDLREECLDRGGVRDIHSNASGVTSYRRRRADRGIAVSIPNGNLRAPARHLARDLQADPVRATDHRRDHARASARVEVGVAATLLVRARFLPRRRSRRRSHKKWSKSTSIVWRGEA